LTLKEKTILEALTMYDLIIIGAGPAGMTAAIYAARKQLKFAIIYKDIGGEIAKTTFIENYTGFKNVSGAELTEIFADHMKMFNPEIIEDQVLSVEKDGRFFKVKTHEKEIETRTILITTGAVPKTLNIPGEKEFASKGVSWCATCDAPLFAHKEVAVIGAGNTGLTSVLQLLDIADKVYLISKYPEPKADAIMVEKAKQNPKFEIVREGKTESINGKRFVESITVNTPEGTRTIPLQGVFINTGYKPSTACLGSLVNLDKAGYIIIDEKNMTSIPGIFAAGDVTNAPNKQIIIAAGHGANAVISIYDYLAGIER
jgi:NADH-dependent peroxiredoxin subunit F